jgi:hypothetical protein
MCGASLRTYAGGLGPKHLPGAGKMLQRLQPSRIPSRIPSMSRDQIRAKENPRRMPGVLGRGSGRSVRIAQADRESLLVFSGSEFMQ